VSKFSPHDAYNLLSTCNRIAVVSHYNPDVDAYGSSLGLIHALKSWDKKVVCMNETGIVGRYDFLPGLSEVKSTLSDEPWDALVVCDCGAWKRVGDKLGPSIKRPQFVLNIDHHTSNEQFGTHNLINESACSTSEIIYEIIKSSGKAFPRESAICLLAGMYGDTGSFRYSSTTAKTFEIAATLVSLGAEPHSIATALYGRTSLGAVRLEAAAMNGLKTHFNGQVVEIFVNQEMLDRSGAILEDADGLVEKGRDIDGVKISVCIREDADILRISLRSIGPEFNVSEIAQSFGGGGHKVAAAFRWRKSLDELRTELLTSLEKLVKGGR